jgi:hypothetical protein
MRNGGMCARFLRDEAGGRTKPGLAKKSICADLRGYDELICA